jgi:hypothetical protein
MKRTVQERYGAIRLPIVDVNSVLHELKNPRTTNLLTGARHLIVVKVVQMLETAKRNQIDGHVVMDVKDIGLLLQAMALTIQWTTEIFHEWYDDDEQT